MTNLARSFGVFCGVAACSLAPQFAFADGRNGNYLCGQTSHFLFDDGSGTLQPGTVTSAFTLDMTFTQFATTRRGYDYYKARSDMNAAGLHSNPYYVNSGLSGEMVGLAHVVINPIAAAPQELADAGLYVGNDEVGATGELDQWDAMSFRVDFLNDALEVMQSYVAEGRITLLGSSSGTAFLPGVTNTYSFSTIGGPARPLIALPGSTGTPAALYLQDITFTTTYVPAPGAIALLGLGGLLATRRRR